MSSIAPEEGDPFIGTTLVGKYQLLELIGVGAMGRVYRAMHLGLDTQVAVKLLNPEIAADPVTARRFQNEARAASRLHHPNAIAILDFGQAASGTLYLVMELLRGRTLAQVVRDEGAVPALRLADLLGQALSALDEAHAAGIIHRDFKPENIFVETLRSGREHVKVLDFGIAKLYGEQETSLTSAGLVCGTPDYMSPEQIRGLDLDARSDVYSAGVVLYEALTGRKLWDGVTALIDVLQAHLHRAVVAPSLRRPDLAISPEVEAVCLRALHKDLKARPASALELKMDLERAGHATRDRCMKCGAARQGGRFCAECGTAFPSLTPVGGVAAESVLSPNAHLPTMHDASISLLGGAAPPPAPPSTLPFCGRDDLLGTLGHLDAVALLVGEAGSGKSRVAQAWARGRRAAGRRVILVEADGPGLVSPLYPLRRAVGEWLGLDERPDEAALTSVLGEHTEDHTGLASLFGADRGRSLLPLDVRRREFRAASLAVLRRADADFVFDDLHLYDAVSRSIIAELASTKSAATVLATSTQADVLPDAPGIEKLHLGPLSGADLAAQGVTAQVIARSGGFPFAIETELRAAADGAKAATTLGRLEALDPEARRVAELLAVAGAPLPRALLEAAAAMQVIDVAITDLQRRGFLETTVAPYRLSSPTLRREIYESLNVERRRAMHARLGALLERAAADVHFVAYHALLSGDDEAPRLADLGDAPTLSPVDGIAALERAGVAARMAFDDAAAARSLRSAMERCRIALMLGLGDERQLMNIELKLGVVLRYAGDLPGAEAVLREAAQLAQERKEGWALVEARRGLARVANLLERPDRARAELNLAVKAALALGDSAILCETYLDLGDTVMRFGAADDAAQELDQGVLLVTQGDGPEATSGPVALARLIARLAEVQLALGRTDVAARLVPHALRLASAASPPLDRARVHAVAAQVRHAEGRLDEASAQRGIAVAELRALGDRRSTAEQLLALAEEAPRSHDTAQKSWLLEAERLSEQVAWQEGCARSRDRLKRLG